MTQRDEIQVKHQIHHLISLDVEVGISKSGGDIRTLIIILKTKRLKSS